MPQVSAIVSFEATDPANADAIIASWTLSPDCTVSATMMVSVGPENAGTDEDGNVVPIPPPDPNPPPDVVTPVEEPPPAEAPA